MFPLLFGIFNTALKIMNQYVIINKQNINSIFILSMTSIRHFCWIHTTIITTSPYTAKYYNESWIMIYCFFFSILDFFLSNGKMKHYSNIRMEIALGKEHIIYFDIQFLFVFYDSPYLFAICHKSVICFSLSHFPFHLLLNVNFSAIYGVYVLRIFEMSSEFKEGNLDKKFFISNQ